MRKFWLGTFTLWQREMTRFYRQPSRVIGAVASPLLFWLLIGSGIGSSFRSGGTGTYLAYFFPGTLLLIVFFTSIFSTISIIEDRREGFLQGVLVAPVPRMSLVLGKVLGGSTLAVLQALIFLALGPLVGIRLAPGPVALAIVALFLNAFLLTTLGFVLAWHFQSIQGFHAVMNLFLMPMWILSGALFPAEGASPWVVWIMRVNPLTYGLTLLRGALSEEAPAFDPAAAGLLVLLAAVVFILAASLTHRPARQLA